ncbi:MAG UNVERIFIED_CONTAM: insulinase family protein [Anaerolineae bacterium]
MKKMFFFWSLLVLVSGLFASVSAQTDDFPFEMVNYTLENGLEVTIVQDSTAPVVAVNVWYRVGGANDPDGRSGFAHLFEHMMFQGTANLDKEQFLRIIEDAGGELNAYTSTDQTVYYETVPAHQLPLALWLEADRMASLAVTQTNLDNQRAVVIQEFQQSYGNSPYGEALLELFTLPFTYSPYQTAPSAAWKI